MKYIATMSLLMFLAISIPATAARVVTIDTAVDLRINSAFVWRGEVINDEPVFQPSVTVGMGKLSANLWGTWDITDVDNSSEHTRMDATIDYTFTDGKHMFRPGLVGYIYYDDADSKSTRDTFEIFAEYVMDVPLLPRLSIYYDFAEKEGLYATFSIAQGFHLIKGIIDMEVRCGIGMGTENYIDETFGVEADEDAGIEEYTADGSGLVDLYLSASFPVIVGENSMLTPTIRYSSLLDSDISDAQDSMDIDVDQLVYGVTFGILF